MNPNNILIADTGLHFFGTWPGDVTSYPTSDVEGTDDTSDLEETNDPYTNGGVLTGVDEPSITVCDRAGANGNTLEYREHFGVLPWKEYHHRFQIGRQSKAFSLPLDG